MLICGILFGAYNVILDPFGVFGDHILNWYAYDMTMNPRIAKVAYLDMHYEEYDSYIIGSSKASSLPVNELNEYLDASFYNMTWYGGDLKDESQMIAYILENYRVKNIILTVDPQSAVLFDDSSDPIKGNMHCKVEQSSALQFYGRYLFANPAYGWEKLTSYLSRGYLISADEVYNPETGCYNKQRRDASPIGSMAEYLAYENNVFAEADSDLPHLNEAIETIADLKALCEKNNVNFMLVGVPVSNDDFYRYDQAQLSQFWRELAEITDFYEFWGNNTVNGDMRYFYDPDHFRNAAGSMALAYIFGNTEQYVPEDFGHLTTKENVEQRITEIYSNLEPADSLSYTCNVPILMYHAFTEDPEACSDTIVLVDDFDEQLRALREAGYHSVTYQQLMDYVYRGKDLPSNPILISIDDGYLDNLTLAAPVLESNGFTATVAVIGCSVGKETYKDTGEPIIPHFSLDQAAEYVKRGVLDFQTHSYDMHQVKELDGEDCRNGVLQLEGEDEKDYITALTNDFLQSKEQLESALDVSCQVYTYPGGLYTELSEVVLQSLGIRVTVTTDFGVNQIIKGIPQSLYRLKRINVEGTISLQALLTRIQEQQALLQ